MTAKRGKSVVIRQDQIDEIDQIEESHPTLRGAGFSAVLRWVIDLGLSVIRREKEKEDNHEST